MPRSFANFSWRIFDLPIFSSIPEFWPTISLLARLTSTNDNSSNWVATTFTNLLDLGSKAHKSKCISVYLITVSSDIEYNRVQLNTTNSEQDYFFFFHTIYFNNKKFMTDILSHSHSHFSNTSTKLHHYKKKLCLLHIKKILLVDKLEQRCQLNRTSLLVQILV